MLTLSSTTLLLNTILHLNASASPEAPFLYTVLCKIIQSVVTVRYLSIVNVLATIDCSQHAPCLEKQSGILRTEAELCTAVKMYIVNAADLFGS